MYNTIRVLRAFFFPAHSQNIQCSATKLQCVSDPEQKRGHLAHTLLIKLWHDWHDLEHFMVCLRSGLAIIVLWIWSKHYCIQYCISNYILHYIIWFFASWILNVETWARQPIFFPKKAQQCQSRWHLWGNVNSDIDMIYDLIWFMVSLICDRDMWKRYDSHDMIWWYWRYSLGRRFCDTVGLILATGEPTDSKLAARCPLVGARAQQLTHWLLNRKWENAQAGA